MPLRRQHFGGTTPDRQDANIVPGGISSERLKSFIQRIERLEENKASVTDDIKDVYAEAKGAGFEVRIIRQIVRHSKNGDRCTAKASRK
jgi:uncharacterized protein (UPF0335 family)